MSDNSAIEWCDSTWNPVRGCDKISAGCKNCYAETFAERWRGIKGHPFEQGFDLRLVPEALDKPLRWRRPRKIFVNSMSDLFHEDIPNEYIAAIFGVMAACPLHTFQVLTKRATRMRDWFDWIGQHGGLGKYLRSQKPGHPPVAPFFDAVARTEVYRGRRGRASDDPWMAVFNAASFNMWPLPSVHLGVSAENQETADERIPLLLQCPAAVRWVSAEPLLGSTSLADLHDGAGGIIKPLVGLHWEPTPKGLTVRKPRGPALDWVVVGGESGPGARPCDLAWIRWIVGQCKAADVPAFVKQLGANLRWDPDGEQWWRGPHTHTDGSPRLAHPKGGDIAEFPEDLRVREFPRSAP